MQTISGLSCLKQMMKTLNITDPTRIFSINHELNLAKEHFSHVRKTLATFRVASINKLAVLRVCEGTAERLLVKQDACQGRIVLVLRPEQHSSIIISRRGVGGEDNRDTRLSHGERSLSIINCNGKGGSRVSLSAYIYT